MMLGLTKVSFLSVINIGNWAFMACFNLTEVSIPAATRIGWEAFAECTSLNRVTLGTITNENFSGSFYDFCSFHKDLRNVYFSNNGGAGTYTRNLQSATPDNWVKE